MLFLSFLKTQSRVASGTEQIANWAIQPREHNNLTYMVKKERVKKKGGGEKGRKKEKGKEKQGVEDRVKRKKEIEKNK